MSFVTAKDGTQIYYKDWGSGPAIVFSHGWPLSADDWDIQMMFFLSHGYRVIAHDRRGHGRSTQVGDGHDMDHYADDLAVLTEHLDLKRAIHVGHSTGGGEVTRYLGRHGQNRVAAAVLISSVPPLMVKTSANPGGTPKEVFDGFQQQVATNRSQFYLDLPTGPFYGYNRPGAKPVEGVIREWWRQGMMGGAKAHYDGIVAFSQTDFTEDLKKITVPVLVMHGDDDQVVPYADAGPLSAKLVKNGTLKTYHGYPHGMPTTTADVINADFACVHQDDWSIVAMSFFKNFFTATNLLGFSFVSLAAAGAPAQAATPIKTVILVHGAWADGSSWSKVIPILKSRGLTVVAVQLPLTSLSADAAVTERAIADAEGPVLLVAHSWGGSVITQVGNDPKVAGLVFVAASAPDVGESFADLIKPYPPAPALGEAKQDTAGFFSLTPKGMADDFAPDLPASESSIMATTQGPLSNVAFNEKATQAAWKTRPSWYIVAGNDRVIPVALEESLAARMKATTTTVPSSHVIMLAHPDEVLAVIESALSALDKRR